MTKSSIKSISMDLEIHTSYMYLMENISAASASSGLWLKRGQKWRGRLKTSPGTKTAKFSNLSSGCFICYKFSAQICSTLSLLCTVTRIKLTKTRSSWLNCALRDDEAVYWVSIGPYEAVAVGNWWYWVSRGHLCLYILHKVDIWTGVTDAWLTDSLTHNFER